MSIDVWRVILWCLAVVVASCVCLLVFFFFQAEDGIRDIGVTGVQTCALPIYEADSYDPIDWSTATTALDVVDHRVEMYQGVWAEAAELRRTGKLLSSLSILRSEERRVGKECRSRWSPYH